jgi:hypothetical protein
MEGPASQGQMLAGVSKGRRDKSKRKKTGQKMVVKTAEEVQKHSRCGHRKHTSECFLFSLFSYSDSDK